jgi:hypothetical protein
MIFNLWVLLLTVCLWAQRPAVDKANKVAIQCAKSLIVSSFDRTLPNVSLEFFLKYEGGGVPIKWAVNDCGEQTGIPPLDHAQGSPICVQADFEFKGKKAVTVLVSTGTFSGRRPSNGPSIISVTITESAGCCNSTGKSLR